MCTIVDKSGIDCRPNGMEMKVRLRLLQELSGLER